MQIRKLFRFEFSHVVKRRGHVSMSLLWHSVQLGFWCVRGHHIFFMWLPVYWAYLNFRLWVICVSPAHLCFSKSGWRCFGLFGCLITICIRMRVHFQWIQLHDFHGVLLWTRRLRITPSCAVVGQLASQHGELYVCGVSQLGFFL